MIQAEAAVEALIGLWEEVLGKSGVNESSNFFAFGGDSLQMMIMLFRVQEAFGVEITPDVLFEKPTLGEFTSHIVLMLNDRAESQEGVL